MRLLTKEIQNGNKYAEEYVQDNMYFEAYLMAVRLGDFGYEVLEDDLEREMKLKHPKITREEYDSIIIEAYDYGLNERDFN